jgi:hypothetical protein
MYIDIIKKDTWKKWHETAIQIVSPELLFIPLTCYFYNGFALHWIWKSPFKVKGIPISKYRNWPTNSIEHRHACLPGSILWRRLNHFPLIILYKIILSRQCLLIIKKFNNASPNSNLTFKFNQQAKETGFMLFFFCCWFVDYTQSPLTITRG